MQPPIILRIPTPQAPSPLTLADVDPHVWCELISGYIAWRDADHNVIVVVCEGQACLGSGKPHEYVVDKIIAPVRIKLGPAPA